MKRTSREEGIALLLSSITFVYFFLPLTLAAYYLVPFRYKNAVLLLTGLIFYSWGEPVYVLLMIFCACLNYAAGIFLDRAGERMRWRKWILGAALAADLIVLCSFKYWGAFTESLASVGVHTAVRHFALPVGITFYTLRCMSYVIDLYRGKFAVCRSIVTFGAFTAMFPLISAGPVVRYSEISEQMERRTISSEKISAGIALFLGGMAKKVILANNIGEIWNQVYNTNTGELSVLSAWLGALAFSFQIYFDFSGYSDMAQGLGKMLGFDFPDNFRMPYTAVSLRDFWSRWHMTLTAWFRSYVYEPLGADTKSRTRWIFNLFVVWLLFGTLHGATLNFIVWGLYFFVMALIEQFWLGKYLEKLPALAASMITFLAVAAGWVIYATGTLGEAVGYFGSLFGAGGSFADKQALSLLAKGGLFFVLCAFFSCNLPARIMKRFRQNRFEIYEIAKPFAQLVVLILCTAYLSASEYNPFLYFQF